MPLAGRGRVGRGGAAVVKGRLRADRGRCGLGGQRNTVEHNLRTERETATLRDAGDNPRARHHRPVYPDPFDGRGLSARIAVHHCRKGADPSPCRRAAVKLAGPRESAVRSGTARLRFCTRSRGGMPPPGNSRLLRRL